MQLVRGKDDNSQEASMTDAMKGRSRRGKAAAGVFGVALATALTLGGSEEATAQSAGPNFGKCVGGAWQNLNDCYMSGSGAVHDYFCGVAFEMDLAECIGRAGRQIWPT